MAGLGFLDAARIGLRQARANLGARFAASSAQRFPTEEPVGLVVKDSAPSEAPRVTMIGAENVGLPGPGITVADSIKLPELRGTPTAFGGELTVPTANDRHQYKQVVGPDSRPVETETDRPRWRTATTESFSFK